MFCIDVNCEGPPRPAPNNPTAANDHADDTFDVASRIIELEQLDPTKELWKDIYGRTGIKKGYIGLFLEKELSKAYQQLSTAKSEAEFNQYAVVFKAVLDNAQVSSKHTFEETYYASPDVAVLSNGFVDETADLLVKKIQEPAREIRDSFNASILATQSILFIPSGGLMGLTGSAFFKSTLDEYVKYGGTLIVLAQQNGSDFSVIPTPDGKPLAAYGWSEDQSCFWNGTYVDTYHQIMSAISSASVSAGVDGYFVSYPENSTILLRRTVGGQPAMLMYEHGQGRVIVNSFYSDWGAAHAQATKEEIAIIRDIISWAKKPAKLPEIKPADTVTLTISVTNSTATDAATVKMLIFNPDRTTLLSEQSVSLPVAAGQSAASEVTWQSTATSQLGIYHIDYLLIDAAGNIIQPQAETDSGRFVLSNPPMQAISKPLTFKVNAPTEKFAQGSNATFTWHVWNSTDIERTVTVRYGFPHHTWETGDQSYGNFNGLSKTITVPAKGEATFDHTITIKTEDQLFSDLYDENNSQIGQSNFKIWRIFPSVNIGIQTDKILYTKGDSVSLTLNLQNKQRIATTTTVTVRVSDPMNLAAYATTLSLTFASNESKIQPLNFILPAAAQGGVYTISAEAFDEANNKIGGNSAAFELPLSLISVTPVLPPTLTAGTNTISFNLNNSSKLAVSAGTLNVGLRDPDGIVIAAPSQPFVLDTAQITTFAVPVNIPELKFGTYTLSYTQSDETRSGKPATISLANTLVTTVSFDKSSYRVRETANLAVSVTNTGRFNLDNVNVAVTAPDEGYADTKTMNIGQGQSLPLQYAIPLPATMTAGQHTVTVTLTLPGGSSVAKIVSFTVPQSLLALSLTQTSYVAGSTISPVIANSGGVDTQAQYRISLYDAKSALLADKSLAETVPANGTLTVNLPVPLGAVDGGYTLVVTYTDQKNGKTDIVQKNLTITGIKAALTLRSDKQIYLSTENINALSGITNSGTLLQGGNLHLQVAATAGSQKQKTWTSQFDFQQGVRDGVDTYGGNDWIVPDDDFNGTAIDTSKWLLSGNVSIQSGRLFADTTQGTASAGVSSNWSLEGDFDIQVDYDSNKSVNNQGPQLAVNGATFFATVHNNTWSGDSGDIRVDGNQYWNSNGIYRNSGKLRLTRVANTLTTYYWTGLTWAEINHATSVNINTPCTITLYVWRWQGYATGASAYYDNFKVNIGRIATKSDTVDSVRLLPMNDNFDDGVINTDRWSLRSSGSVTTNENNGALVTADTQVGVQSYANVSGHFPLVGDFDISVDWKTPIAPASGDWGAIFQISEMDQNKAPDNNLVGNALQIKRSYINGGGHTYYTGHYNGSSWDAWSAPVSTTDTAGRFRIKRAGTSVTVWYWNNALSRWEWNGNTAGYMWNNVWSTPTYVQIGVPNNTPNRPLVEADWNNFEVGAGAAYPGTGTIRLKQDAGQISGWQTITWGATQPVGTSVKFRTRTAADEAGLSSAAWSDYLTTSGSSVPSLPERWIEIEATLSTTDATVTPLLNDVTVTYGNNPGDIVWQADVAINLAQAEVSNLTNVIGTIGTAGKYYLQGTLTSSTVQTIATAEYPFYVAQGNTTMSVNLDRKLYKPGDTVTITGEVKNLSTVNATNLTLILKGKPAGGADQTLDTETFTIPAGGSRPFTVTTTAGAEGTVTLTGTVTQNSTPLTQISDQYRVAAPQVTATLTSPDVAGNDPFTVSLQMTNGGKTDATVTVGKSFSSQPETVTVPAGLTRLLQYAQQITGDASYTFTMTGDLTQTVTKTVKYGPAATVALAPSTLYPEGKIAISTTIANTGLLDGQFAISYQLAQGANVISQQTTSYYLQKADTTTDTISFDLTEGSYQLTVAGQLPAIAASTSFSVRKEVKTDFSMTVGTQSWALLPVTAGVTNLGFNALTGTVRLSLIDSQGTVAWSISQDFSLPQSPVPSPHSLNFTINLSAVTPGSFTIKAELLDAANRQLAVQTAPFTLLGAVFDITQQPPYQTISAGGSTTMTFKVKNSGNQEGNFDLFFKADDLIDSTQTAWLKPGEEKEIAFNFQAATDLEEKDYTATYRLKSGGATLREGVLAYHLAGLKLAVSATLDKQDYSIGDTATLTLTISQQDAGASPSLFARVNYAGYEEKRDFTLNGSKTLTFTVPLSQITGEKLFYGIYHQSGRSIHLNSVYVYKTEGILTVATDKQVYQPGEAVKLSISGSASGDLTLTGPGDFSNTFAFAISDTRSFVLPSIMAAGTYTVSYSLTDSTGKRITGSTPFDVAGIQVKVKEALLDKAKYVSTDIMNLALTIESNLDIPATVRTWVVDPAGGYTPAGEGAVALTSAMPILVTQNSKLETTSLGIHKLVYGIYQGDLLLASGAKAFDIGEAVLLGLSTDKIDYPEIMSPVIAKADLYGSADVGLEFFLDNTSIKADTVTLAGFTGYTLAIPPADLTPGLHRLKAVLVSGGLTSTKEMSFTYGSNLADLTVRLSRDAVNGRSLNLTATVSNQGKITSGATSVALYDGDPTPGAIPFATLNVPALAPNATVTIPYSWNVLGKAGEYVVYAVIDPANMVAEYNEANNTTLTTGSLPNLVLGVSTGGASFRANAEIGITANYANLSTSALYQDLVLRVELTNPQGVVSVLKEITIASLAPATEATDVTVWNTTTSLPGSYTVNARLVGDGSTLLANSAAFAIEATLAVTGSLTLNNAEIGQGTPLTVAFTATNSGNFNTNGVAKTHVIDPQSGAVKATAEQPVNLPVGGSQSGEFTFPSQGFELKSYLVSLQYVSQESQFIIANSTFAVKDGTPPVVTVLSPQVGTAYNSTLSFTALATDDASGVEKVECQVDDGAWNILPVEDAVKGSYATAWQPTAANNGVHTVRYKATDRAINTSSPVSVTFTSDTVPPVLKLSTLSDGAYTNNETLNIAGNVHDDLGFGELRINDAPVLVNVDQSFSSAFILKSGTNIVSTIATDLAKNRTIDTRTICLDQTAPVLIVTAPADNSKTGNQLIALKGTVDENATVEVKIKDNIQFASINDMAFTATVGLEPGLNTIEITARDPAGNLSAQKRTVLYDDQKPSLSVTEPNQDIRTNRSSITVKGMASDPLTAVGVTITKDAETLTPPVINGFFEQVVTFTEEKPYAINVTATNEVGTQTSVQRNVIYDITPPVLAIDPLPSQTNQSSQVVSGTRESGTIVSVSCATATVGETIYPTATTWKVSVTNLKAGENIVTATSGDTAGNHTTASAKIVYVERAPDVTITATPALLWPPDHKMVSVMLGGEAISHGSDLKSVSISVTDEYGKYSCNNQKFGATVMLEAWRDGNDLNGRIYTITAAATDMAGNTTTKTTTVIVPHDQSK